LSRLRFLLTFVALFAIASAFVACGGGDGGSENPQTVVDDATLQGIESADVDLSLNVNAKGGEGGNVKVSLSGPFQSEGGEELPQLDMTAKANGSLNGEDIDFDGGLTLLPNTAYVRYEGVEYAVDPTTFSFVQSTFKKAQEEGGGGGQTPELSACQDTIGNLKVADFIDNVKDEGSVDVGGTATTKVSGDLNVSGALDSAFEFIEDPDCASQLGATGSLPSSDELDEARSEVKGAVKTAKIELYVGDDNIVRRVVAKLKIEPSKDSGGGPRSVAIDLDLTLTGVNEDQEIAAPTSAKPLSKLFLKLGVNPIELLPLLEGKGGGLGNLLEGLGGSSGGSSTGGGSGSSGSGSGGQQAYLNCLGNARTPADLQKCAEQR
jgi:hypothetical protein